MRRRPGAGLRPAGFDDDRIATATLLEVLDEESSRYQRTELDAWEGVVF
jgi:hypothetical protein